MKCGDCNLVLLLETGDLVLLLETGDLIGGVADGL
jgi:hypothetical protein